MRAYGDSRRRKSAVQNHWITLSRITVRPKVTISEVSSLMLNVRKPISSATPAAKKPGTITTSVSIGSTPDTVAIW